MYYHPQLGPEFMKQFFGKMDMTFARDNRQMTDWLAAGKYAICVGCLNVARSRFQELPVDDFVTTDWKEGSGMSAGPGTISLIDKSAHCPTQPSC